MANPIQHAQQAYERTHNHVQPYMADLFNRLASNYALIFGLILFVNLIGIPLLMRFAPIPVSTANVLGFSLMLLILVYGWRYLENRNRATSLFVLYIRYSRQRRDLQEKIGLAKEGALDNDDTLYIMVDLLEESAESLLQGIEDQGLKAHPTDS